MNFFKKKDKQERKEEKPPVEAAGPGVTAKLGEGMVSTKDIIAPGAIEIDFNHVKVENKYYRTLFVAAYPRFVGMNWLSALINFDSSLNVSMYVYPADGKQILDDLRRKIAEMEAEISTDVQRGRVVNPGTQAKLEDALNLQADLAKGEERFFQFGLYITISADSVEELNRINKNLEASLGALMIISKKATLQMEEGFTTNLPICSDKLSITRNMDTTSLATTFPFVSSDLSDDKGVMYGINQHNGSLVIFDRFSMPNYNSVVFATAGAGKSYMIKLEALRSLMLGTDIIVIDPENEYKSLCEAVGGQYIAFGYNEPSKINPFDLGIGEEDEEEKRNALNDKILSLHKLLKVMLGEMTPVEESILDRAVVEAYKAKGITPDTETQKNDPPLLEDLYKALIGKEEKEAANLAARLEKYIKGSFAGIFNQKTTVNLDNKFVVFGIRNLEDSLRPVAMQIILDYIWNTIRKELRKRILIVDEAWYLMQYQDSAAFLRGIVKRSRKYFLGVTTITQDVDDFLETPYGKEIVTNSSIQILLKQHSAAIDKVGEVFYLSEGEKQLLLAANKGEGIFFAGQNHVAIQVISSKDEHGLITSNPEELVRMKAAAGGPNSLKIEPQKIVEEKREKGEIARTEEIKEMPSQPPSNSWTVTKTEPASVSPTSTIQDNGQVNPIKIADKQVEVLSEQTVGTDTEEEKPKETEVGQISQPKIEEVPATGGTAEDSLKARIEQLEKEEEKELSEFREKEEKQKIAGTGASGGKPNFNFGGQLGGMVKPSPGITGGGTIFGGLPKTTNQAAGAGSSDGSQNNNTNHVKSGNLFKAEVVDNNKTDANKPKVSFVAGQGKEPPAKQPPQPPQLQKAKIKPVFEDKKAENENKNKEMGYDELFGNPNGK